MTMPDERMRSLRWGCELLGELVLDTTLPEALRARARDLVPAYPVPHGLVKLLDDDAAALPQAWVAAMTDALDLFEEIRLGLHGSEETRKSLRFTLRHFPDKGTIRQMGKADKASPLAWWLAAEDRYR